MDQRIGSGFINKKAFLLRSFVRRPPLGCPHVRKNWKNETLKANEPNPQIPRSPATLSHETLPNAPLHHSSIAANSNSKLHQFRPIPSNSDQTTPQKKFFSEAKPFERTLVLFGCSGEVNRQRGLARSVCRSRKAN